MPVPDAWVVVGRSLLRDNAYGRSATPSSTARWRPGSGSTTASWWLARGQPYPDPGGAGPARPGRPGADQARAGSRWSARWTCGQVRAAQIGGRGDARARGAGGGPGAVRAELDAMRAANERFAAALRAERRRRRDRRRRRLPRGARSRRARNPTVRAVLEQFTPAAAPDRAAAVLLADRPRLGRAARPHHRAVRRRRRRRRRPLAARANWQTLDPLRMTDRRVTMSAERLPPLPAAVRARARSTRWSG